MESPKVNISKYNYQLYNKMKSLMDILCLLDDISVGIGYSVFGEKANNIIIETVIISPKSFKDFVLDTKEGDDILLIDYKEYEKLIEANYAYNTIMTYRNKLDDVDFVDYDNYGLFLEALIKCYKNKP